MIVNRFYYFSSITHIPINCCRKERGALKIFRRAGSAHKKRHRAGRSDTASGAESLRRGGPPRGGAGGLCLVPLVHDFLQNRHQIGQAVDRDVAGENFVFQVDGKGFNLISESRIDL